MTKLLIWLLIATLLWDYIICDEDEDSESNENVSGDCHCDLEVYQPEQEAGYIKSPHYPNFDGCNGKCVYIILPHENKTVSLYAPHFEISEYASLEIFSIIRDGDSKILIPHAKVTRKKYYSDEGSFPSFVSAKNVGFEIHFKSHSNYYYTNFKISFDRHYDYGEICDFPIIEVGEEETVVQRDHYYAAASGCVYLLKPKLPAGSLEENEIMIHIHSSRENEVHLRVPDENGKMRAGRPSRYERTLLESGHKIEVISQRNSKEDSLFKMTKITARLIRRQCTCDPEKIRINSNESSQISLHSPGFPDMFCPSQNCYTEIIPTRDEYDDDKMALFEVSVKSALGSDDYLTIRSEAKLYFDTEEPSDETGFTRKKFVIKQQPFSVKWTSGHDFDKRNYEVNVTMVRVDPDCACPLYKDKDISEPRELEFVFPQRCDYVYCYLHFVIDSYYNHYAIEYNVTGAVDNDRVILQNSKITERDGGLMLGKTKRFETESSSEFTFHRSVNHSPSFGKTILSIAFKDLGRKTSCNGKLEKVEFGNKGSHRHIINSPGYPVYYPADQKCYWLLSFPENSRLQVDLDEISLENFHDHLSFYNGNSTQGTVLAKYTAHLTHEFVYFENSPILMVFTSDRSTSDRGFHVTLSTDLKPLPEDDTQYFISFALVIFLIILIILVVLYIRNKRSKKTGSAGESRVTIDSDSTGHGAAPGSHDQQSNLDYVF